MKRLSFIKGSQYFETIGKVFSRFLCKGFYSSLSLSPFLGCSEVPQLTYHVILYRDDVIVSFGKFFGLQFVTFLPIVYQQSTIGQEYTIVAQFITQ